MTKECLHENVKSYGRLQGQKYVINADELKIDDIPGLTVEIEECLDCGEVRKEYHQKEINTEGLRNTQEYRQHSYKTKEEYYTNGGHLVEKDYSGNWYWNGHKMTKQALDRKMTLMGDKMGRQDVSDQFKELAHMARNKSEAKTHEKKLAVEKLRDAWK